MKVFLTGGTGFIGKHVLKQLLGAGHEVVAIHRSSSTPAVEFQKQPQWLERTLDDVTEQDLSGCDALIHLAAHGVSNPQAATWDDCFYWNVTASLKLWQHAANSGVRRMIICGSCFEYGRSGEIFEFIPVEAPLEPTGPYHSSKAAATMAAFGLAIDKEIEMIILRPFHIYGEGEAPNRFWPSLKLAAQKGEDFPMSDGTQVRDFVEVSHAAERFLDGLLRDDLKPGEPVIENIGSGNPCSLLEFATREWLAFHASGRLLPGAKPQRSNETMRYVPRLPGIK